MQQYLVDSPTSLYSCSRRCKHCLLPIAHWQLRRTFIPCPANCHVYASTWIPASPLSLGVTIVPKMASQQYQPFTLSSQMPKAALEARLIQLWSPTTNNRREWTIADPDMHGLPLSQAVVDNIPADISILLEKSPPDISISKSDITTSSTELLSTGYWSIWSVY